MPGQRIGSIVAAVFGLVYVVVNSSHFAAPVMWVVRACAVAAAVAIAIALASRRGEMAGGRGGAVNDTARHTYPRSFWLVTAGEVIALFGGVLVINRVFHRPEASVAWVSIVVGVHFLPMARMFSQRFFYLMGAAIIVCGLVGLVLVARHAPEAVIAAVSGVVPGAILLGFGLWGSRRRAETVSTRSSLISAP